MADNVYVSAGSPSDVSKFNSATYANLGNVTVPNPPAMVVSPDFTTVYGVDGTGQVNTIDAATLVITDSATLPGSGTPYENITISPDGTTLYITARGINLVYVLDAATLATITTWAIPGDPYGIAPSPDGLLLYCSEEIANTVVAIDTTTGSVVHSVTVGNDPVNMCLSSDGSTLYVCNFLDCTVSVIDTASFTVTTTIGPLPGGFQFAYLPAIAPDDSALYVVEGFSPVIWHIDPATNTVVNTIIPPGNAQAAAITSDSKSVWIAETGFGTTAVEIYNIPGDTLAHSIPYGTTPDFIVILPPNFVPPPPSGLTVGLLFIPRKGRGAALGEGYTEQDLLANWLAIELWADHAWDPPVTDLFIPAKPSNRMPTVPEIDQNWLTIERWSQGLGVVGGVTIPPLFVPREGSLEPVDLDINFLTIQRWANSLNP